MMRSCPFCSADTPDDQPVCAACGRRLPPAPPRARSAPPATGITLPPRAPSAPSIPGAPLIPSAPRRSGTTLPPPLPSVVPAPPISAEGAGQGEPIVRSAPPPPMPPPGLASAGMLPVSPGVMVSPGAMTAAPGSHAEIPVPPDEAARRSLLAAISPGPAAQRRAAPPPELRGGDPRARRVSDQPIPSVPRAGTPSRPPPLTPTGAPVAVVPLPPSGPTPLGPGMSSSRSRTPSIPPPTPPARTGAPSTPPPFTAAAPGGDPPTGAVASPPLSDAPTGVGFAAPAAGFAAPAAGFAPASPPPPYPPPPLAIEASAGAGIEPPPTRIHRPEALADRPFAPPKVNPVPELPEPGLYPAARYALRFARARFQRRGAIRSLQADIRSDTDALDQVLGALGRVARTARVDGRVFNAENVAINAAEERTAVLQKEHADVDLRKGEENSRFEDVERERNAKLSEAERLVDEVSKELAHLEGQRRSLRDKRKELERRQKAYLKTAEDSERQASGAQMGESRADLRRSAEQMRKEAAALEPERQDVDRRLAGLERPIGEATARLDAAKAELDAAKRSLADAREGHTHRLAELDAEQKRKAREIGQAEAEISRRLVTLGTLVNLNRIDGPAFVELYARIDRLRTAITARTTEIEKLTAEREAYDRGSLVRGVSVIGGAVVALLALIVILRALL